jgi:hypothetical protein
MTPNKYHNIYFKVLTNFFYLGKVRITRMNKDFKRKIYACAGKIPEFCSGAGLGTIRFLLSKP